MSPLSRTNVHAFVRTAVPKSLLRSGDEDIVHQFSAGHPLSLAYLVKRLAAAPDPTAAAEVLDKVEISAVTQTLSMLLIGISSAATPRCVNCSRSFPDQG